jgi:phosphatidylserine/phosphatidylglycerophosphate/cardiolipin synthase-like enzyme
MLIRNFVAIFYNIFFCLLAFGIQAQPTTRPYFSPGRSTFPAQFGKTHFIIGAPYASPPIQETISEIPHIKCQSMLCTTDGKIAHALFSPDDNVQDVLIDLINKEQKCIDIAVFSFTNKKIAQALLRAHERGIRIRIIVDQISVHDRFGKIHKLCKGGLKNICVYQSTKRKSLFPDRMHNKFIIFGKNILNKTFVWTGSFNFTRSATQANQENVVIVENINIMNKFKKQFKVLLARSLPIKKS